MLDLMLVIYGTEVEDLSFDTILLPFTYTSRNGSQSDYKFESTVNINSYLFIKNDGLIDDITFRIYNY